MTVEEYKKKIKEMGNAQLLNEVDYFFGYDPYYKTERDIVFKELERRLNVVEPIVNTYERDCKGNFPYLGG